MATTCYEDGRELRILLLALILFSASGYSEQKSITLKIGALFDPRQDIQSERVFDFSIAYYNKLSILPNVTLLAVKERAGILDPYHSIIGVKKLINQRVTAVIGPSTSMSVRATNVYCSRCKVPQIAPTATDPTFKYQSQLYPFLVRMQSTDDIQAVALVDLIKHYKWGKLSILSSTVDYGNSGMMEFRKLCEEEGLEINIDESFAVSSSTSELSQSAREVLARVKSQQAKLLVLNCHTLHAKVILEMASELHMVKDWVWILLDGAITETIEYPLGVIGVRSSIRQSTLYKGVSKLWAELYPQRRMSTRAAKTFDAVTALVYALKRLPNITNLGVEPQNGSAGDFCLYDEHAWNSRNALMAQIQKTEVEGLTQLIAFTKQGSQVHASYDVINFDRSKTWHKVGCWSKEGSPRLSMDPSHLVVWPHGGVGTPNDATIDIRFKRFRVLTAVSPPFVIQSNTTLLGRTDRPFVGFCIDLLEAIREELGFNYDIESRTTFGHKDPSGQWTGIFGELIRKEADLAVSTFTISPERQNIIDFTQPFFNLGFKILMKKSDRMTEHNIWGFLSPFSMRLWIAIICSTVVIGIVVWVYDVLSPNGFYGRYAQAKEVTEEDQEQKCTLSFSNSYWSATAAYLAQGPDGLHPRAPSGRITTITWWFAIYLFGATYTANLVAFLTVDQWAFPIQTIDDLANQEKILYGTIPHSQLADMLEKGSLPLYEKMWTFMQRKNTLVDNVKSAVDRVRSDPNFAFIWDSSRLDYAVNTPPCNTLVTVGRPFGNINYGFALPPNSPYTQNFSIMLLKLRRHGFIDKLNEKWFSGRARCGAPHHEQHSDSGNSAEELGVLDLAGVFVTIATGVGAACVVLLCEIITASYQDRGERNLNIEAPRTMKEAIRQRLRRARWGLLRNNSCAL